MNRPAPDQEFWNVADGFIALANQRCDTVGSGKVSAAMLYSAARFNAFVAASGAKSKEQYIAERENTVAYFAAQFDKMLRENLSDYEANYEKYIGETRA